MKKLIVIAGPTASGKTALAVSLAHRLKCQIVSADSRQFYKEMSIGTAKPSIEEMEGVPHHFIDSHSITAPLSAVQFEKEALACLEELFSVNDYVILVGGSGMFIKALIEGTDELPHDKSVQEKWNQLHTSKGLSSLQEELKSKDPIYFNNKVDQHNPVRLIRALEIIELTGKKLSDLTTGKAKERPFETDYYVLNHPREVLYNRINLRVDMMFENGLLEEARSLLPFKSLQALNTVGYKELFDYFDGEHNLETAKELIKRNTRRYAKRQLTWFKGVEDAVWLDGTLGSKKLALEIGH